MSEPPDLRELLGGDDPELERLREVDAALRATPEPPEVPDSLTERVLAIPSEARSRPARPVLSRRRVLAGLGVAAVVAGAAFGIGVWVAGSPDGRQVAEVITLERTPAAPPRAGMVIDVRDRDAAGNWVMSADAWGLKQLPDGGVYEVWMTAGKDLVSPCGRFVVGEDGRANDIWLNAPYPLRGHDRWVVVSVLPGEEPSPWLLDGPVVNPT